MGTASALSLGKENLFICIGFYQIIADIFM